MDSSTIIAIISIIFNIILFFLLLFKSVLNEIVKEWWLDRKKKKEKDIERLIAFKTNFNDLYRLNFVFMMLLAEKQLALRRGIEFDPTSEAHYQNSVNTVAEARKAIEGFIDFLPADLRACFEHYMKRWQIITTNIISTGQITKEDLKESFDKMTALGTDCSNLADSKIKEKLDS